MSLAGVFPGGQGRCVRLAFGQPDGGSAAAGVYTADIKIPGNCILVDVGIHAVALWNAGTSATAIVGDVDDPNGYFAAVDMKATDLLAGESINLVAHGGKAGAYVVGTLPTGHWEARFDADERTITLEITTVGTAPTTGDSILWATWIEVPKEHPKGRLPYGSYVAS